MVCYFRQEPYTRVTMLFPGTCCLFAVRLEIRHERGEKKVKE